MDDPRDFYSSGDDPAEGDGAAHVTLSEAIPSILDMIDECASDLVALRCWLGQQELPEELDVDESELERPAVQARRVAEKLETYAKALRNASGETGNADMSFD